MERTITTLFACLLCGAMLLLAGCSLTPTQKKVAGIVAGVLVVGAITAERSNDGADQRVATPYVDCVSDPASCR